MSALEVVSAQLLLDARRRVEQIRGNVEDIKVLVVEAYRARDWETLGYATWAEYCTEEFGGTIAIPREERGDVVFTLRDAGLSTRAIGAAIGVSKDTVARDLAGVSDETPAPAPAQERIDHAENQAADADPGPAHVNRHIVNPHVADPDDDVVDAELVDETPPPTITGTDGKTYRATRVATGDTSRRHSGAQVLSGEDPATLCAQSAPRGSTKTYRELFNNTVLHVVTTADIGDLFSPDRVVLVAESSEEYASWIADLRTARQSISAYIHKMETAAGAQRDAVDKQTAVDPIR